MKLTKGVKVMWSGGWNSEPEKEVTIESVYKGSFIHNKDGDEIESIDFKDKDICTFDLDNGHWCYGDQIHSIASEF